MNNTNTSLAKSAETTQRTQWFLCAHGGSSCSLRSLFRSIIAFSILLLAFCVAGCKKLVEVNPPSNTTNSGNVYANDATAIAAVTNIYVSISKSELSLSADGITSLSLLPALSADELSLYGGASNNAVSFYYKNALTAINLNNPDFWSVCYKTIFDANAALEGLSNSTTLTPAVKQQLTGEVKFIRAFCYFYLVNLYGDVPLALGTDYKVNSRLSRMPKDQVYQQIITDLKEAKELLNAAYIDASLLRTSVERVRPTKWAAIALLARTYLYTGEWANAEMQSTAIINNSAVYDTVPLKDVFLKNSKESIWQLQPVNAGWNTEDARVFVLPTSGPSGGHPFYLNNLLVNSLETGDKRRPVWTSNVTINGIIYYYPTKYKSAVFNDPVTEYNTVLRFGEQYLIRAEARAQLNNIPGSQSDLNIIRKRAGLPNTTANDKPSLLAAILRERQVELFTEWGHRWFDLKRTGKIDAVMNIVAPQKGGTWSTNWQWYPIAQKEINLNNNLVQNIGY